MQTEAALLQQMHVASTPAEQRRLAAELAAVREAKAAEARQQMATGLSATALAEVAARRSPGFVHHSMASDWLGEVPTSAAPAVEATMRAKASVWYAGLHEAVKADPEEVTVQAAGMARREASAHGLGAAAAEQAFLGQVEHQRAVEGRTAALAAQAAEEVQKPPYGVPSGSSLPNANDKSTFDDSLLTAPGGADPKTAPGDAASLKEGDSPEGDSAQGIDNPAVDSTHDTVKGTEYTDPNPSGGSKTSRRVVAEDTDLRRSGPEHFKPGDTYKQPETGGGLPGESAAWAQYLSDAQSMSHADAKAKYDKAIAELKAKASLHTADDQTSTEADKGDTPSLSEGDSPEGDHAEPVIEGPKGADHVRDGGNGPATDSIDGTVYQKRSLREIAASIPDEDASFPFVQALAQMDSINDTVAGVPGRDVVGYVLRTATLTDGQRFLLERVATGEVVPPFRAEAADGPVPFGWEEQPTDAWGGDDNKVVSIHGKDYTPAEAARAARDLRDEIERLGPSDGRVTEYNALAEALGKPAWSGSAGKTSSVQHEAVNTGAHGWPLVPRGAGEGFPGEHRLACPKCGGGVIMQGVPGYDGRMGSPGEGELLRCKECGHSSFEPRVFDHRSASLSIDPAFAARVQASLSKEAVPSYINELDSGEQYEEGYSEGQTAEKVAPPYADGLEDGAEGKPRSKFHEYH